MMSQEIKIVQVTPALAAKWLGRNTKNRPLREERVKALVRDMQEGRWQFNGAAIVIDVNRMLLDGQHRLAAILQSGMTFDMAVAMDVDPEAFGTIDAGARRSNSDALSVAGQRNALTLSGTLRMLVWYNAGQPPLSSFKMTNSETIDALKIFPHAPEMVSRVIGDKGLREIRTTVPFIAAMCEASQLDADLTDGFMARISDGANLSVGDPRHTLRAWMINRPNRKRVWPDLTFNVTAKAWNAHAAGKRVGVLKMAPNEAHVRLVLPNGKP